MAILHTSEVAGSEQPPRRHNFINDGDLTPNVIIIAVLLPVLTYVCSTSLCVCGV